MSKDKEEERKPMISIGTTYENYLPIGPPVDETLRLEVFLIASALFSWAFNSQEFFWLIDHIKGTFCLIKRVKDEEDEVEVIFKLTIRPTTEDPPYSFKITWNKNEKTLEAPIGENQLFFDCINDCASKDQVVADIKKIICHIIRQLSAKKIKNGQYLAKLALKIKESV